MDFIHSYLQDIHDIDKYVDSAGDKRTDDFSQGPCDAVSSPVSPQSVDEEGLEAIKSGRFGGLRKSRKSGQKRKPRVHFLAPLPVDDEPLSAIRLTPRVASTPNDVAANSKSGSTKNRGWGRDQHESRRESDGHAIKIFGFSLKRSASR